MKKNRGFIILCICYLLYYITLGVYSPYLNVYYERVGLNGSQIGLINSCGYIAAMVFSPLWGNITDKTHRYKTMISVLMMATALTGIIWQKQTLFIWIFILSLFMNIFRSNIGNLFDGFSMQFCKEYRKEYSMVRSMGSLGYLIGSFVIANLLFQFLHLQGPYMQVLLIISVLTVALLTTVPNPHFEAEKKKHDFISNMKELIRNHDYLFVLAISFFTVMVMDTTVSYLGNHLIMTLHLDDSSIGLSTFAMVLPEVFIVMQIHRFIHKYGIRKVYLLACFTQMLRCGVYALSTNLAVILLVSCVHGIMIGVGSVGVFSFIHKKVPEYMLATAMTLYGGFTVIGYAVLSQLYGWIYQLAGSNMIFVVTLIFAAIAGLMIFKSKRFDDVTD